MTDVLLFTGGVDSVVAYYYLKKELGVEKIKLLYVDLGTKYSEIEKQTIEKISERMGVEVEITKLSDYGQWEKPNAEVPGRNAILGIIGSLYADSVWMVFQLGETINESNDRSPTFCQNMTNLLSGLHGKMVVVDSPLWDKTKTQMVEWMLHNVDNAEEILKETFSCYYPQSVTSNSWKPCGNCGACFRRSMALELNGIVGDYLDDKIIEQYERNQEKYRSPRKEEMKEFLDRIYHRNGAEERSLWDGKKLKADQRL